MTFDLQFNRKIFDVMIACSLIMMALYSVFMVQPIFIEMAQDLEISVINMRFTFTIVSLSYAVSFFLVGPLTDYFDEILIVKSATFLLFISATFMVMSSQFYSLLSTMLLIGIFSAAIVASMFSYMARIANSKNLGRYMGFCLSATVTGIILGRLLTGVFTAWFSWQIAVSLFMAIIFSLLTATIFLQPPSLKQPKSHNYSLVNSYFKSLILFKNKHVSLMMLVGGLLFFSYLGCLTFLTYRLANTPFNLDAEGIGWLSATGFIAAIFAPFAGSTAQKIGVEKVLVLGLSLFLVALFMLLFVQTIVWIAIALSLFYLSVYICQPAAFFAISKQVNQHQKGAASSLYLLVCLGSGSIASAVLAPIWNSYGWQGIILMCAGAITLALLLVIIMKLALKEQSIN